MSIVTIKEPTKVRAFDRWEELGNAGTGAATRLSRDRVRAARELVCGHSLAKRKLGLEKMQNTVSGLLQHTIAAAMVVFYSKNLLAAAIRSLIST
jgi:hypothetical protein